MTKRLICCLLMLTFLLSLLASCNDGASDTQSPKPQQTTQTADTSAADDATPVTAAKETEDTESVSLVPYTLKHNLTDLTDQMPHNVLNTIPNKHQYIKDGTLYLNYVAMESDKQALMLLPITSDGIAEPIRVPTVDSRVPWYAYAASGDRFVLTVQMELGWHICITDADGNILSSLSMPREHTQNNHYHVSEDADSNISILMEYGDEFYFFYYDAAQNLIEQVRKYIDDYYVDPNFGLASAAYLGNSRWLGSNGQTPAILDMSRGTLQKYGVRLPGELMLYTFRVSADGKIYFFDTNGIYQYKDNAIPTKVLDYNVCSLRLDSRENNRLWVVNEHEFFVLTYQTVDGVRQPQFYQVQTELVPDTDPRPYIEILSYSHSEWLSEAVNRFNEENPSYRVKIDYVNTVNRFHEDLNAELQEKILYQSHPDILVWGDSPWRPLDTYYDKNTFLDLMPYLGDHLLGCIREAASYGDALYSVPTDMWLQTFVCAEDITDTFLTWDTFFDVIDRIESPAVLTSEPMAASQIFENGVMDFCDFDTMTSYYNTEQFRDMVTYCYNLGKQIDKQVGRIDDDIMGNLGYTNATLPARIADGGLAFLTTPIMKLDHILAPMLLYGGLDFTWCGYPSREGGGAYLNMANYQFSVFADTDVANGCIAFLSLLLSDEEQSNYLHPYLPVTQSGMRSLIEKNRYFYYDTEQYQSIGDPNAELKTSAGGTLGASSSKVISLTADGSASVYYEDYGKLIDNNNKYTVVELTDAYADAFLYFLNNCHMKAGLDLTLSEIITEEISYWQNNARTLEETTKIIDSRVWIYLNE